jgi:hypothetical protein
VVVFVGRGRGRGAYSDFLDGTSEAPFREVGEDVFVADGDHDDDDYRVEVGHYVVGDVVPVVIIVIISV